MCMFVIFRPKGRGCDRRRPKFSAWACRWCRCLFLILFPESKGRMRGPAREWVAPLPDERLVGASPVPRTCRSVWLGSLLASMGYSTGSVEKTTKKNVCPSCSLGLWVGTVRRLRELLCVRVVISPSRTETNAIVFFSFRTIQYRKAVLQGPMSPARLDVGSWEKKNKERNKSESDGKHAV